MDNPRIALAVIVENAGFGAQAAAPISRIALDYYLLGKRPEPPKETDKPAAARPGAPAPARPPAQPSIAAANAGARSPVAAAAPTAAAATATAAATAAVAAAPKPGGVAPTAAAVKEQEN